MTTINVKLRPSSVADRPGSIVYLVTRHRMVRQITTGYRLYQAEWDDKKSKVIISSGERADVLKSVMQNVRCDMERLSSLIDRYGKRSYDYTSDEIVAEFQRITHEGALFRYMEGIIDLQCQTYHLGTAKNYRSALNSFRSFRSGRDIPVDTIDYKVIEEYQNYLKSAGKTLNSISFYMRILRAVYNRAVNDGLTPDRKPFRSVFTSVEKTRKRAISVQDIRRIRNLKLSNRPGLAYSRDIFMFLFFCRGMSFVDAAFLKKSDVYNGVITYRRQKTGQILHVRVVNEIEEIIDRYSVDSNPYLLPIIFNPEGDERKQYESALRRTNKNLKIIAGMVCLPVPLTTYVSRHTWATIAKNKNVPINVISDALGHDSVLTTQVYLGSIDASVIDKANDLIIRDL